MSNLQSLLEDFRGAAWTRQALATVSISPSLIRAPSPDVVRAELAQALNLVLFMDLIQRVPVAQDYVNDVVAAGRKVNFDHGALRTVRWASGGLPPGEASITRVLRSLGYRHRGTYPLERLNMTGRSWAHADHPEEIAQFFVSELHPERFSAGFQLAVSRVIGASRDPLQPADIELLERLDRDGGLPRAGALALLPRMEGCFARHHGPFSLDDYEAMRSESAEMAWIATEGNVFNHATDRVPDVQAVSDEQRRLGRPIKDQVEVSQSGRVRQTAFRATEVERAFFDASGRTVHRQVPGSFYEFISRDPIIDGAGAARLDLQFDAGNATGIFGMTRPVEVA